MARSTLFIDSALQRRAATPASFPTRARSRGEVRGRSVRSIRMHALRSVARLYRDSAADGRPSRDADGKAAANLDDERGDSLHARGSLRILNRQSRSRPSRPRLRRRSGPSPRPARAVAFPTGPRQRPARRLILTQRPTDVALYWAKEGATDGDTDGRTDDGEENETTEKESKKKAMRG